MHTVFMIRHKPTGNWCAAGLYRTPNPKIWATVTHAKSAIERLARRFPAYHENYEIVACEITEIGVVK